MDDCSSFSARILSVEHLSDGLCYLLLCERFHDKCSYPCLLCLIRTNEMAETKPPPSRPSSRNP